MLIYFLKYVGWALVEDVAIATSHSLFQSKWMVFRLRRLPANSILYLELENHSFYLRRAERSYYGSTIFKT